jgi:hypothetical protein
VPVCGFVVAWFDIARGHYEIRTAGLPPKWGGNYSRLLRERYGIRRVVFAGCSIGLSESLYACAYDAVSMTAAKRKFGSDVFAECAADARKAWEAERIAEADAEAKQAIGTLLPPN